MHQRFDVRTLSTTALRAVFLSAVAVAGGWPSRAEACPFCRSSTAEQIRAGIFDSDFLYNLGVSAAPFVVLAAVLILILYWPTKVASQPVGQPTSEPPTSRAAGGTFWAGTAGRHSWASVPDQERR